jgi:hypothetical protein
MYVFPVNNRLKNETVRMMGETTNQNAGCDGMWRKPIFYRMPVLYVMPCPASLEGLVILYVTDA